MMQVVSAISLMIVMGCCLLAIFSHGYRDNWFQFWGLVGVLFWSAARLASVLEGFQVTGLPLLGHVSLATFALGEAYHYWDKWRRNHPASYPDNHRAGNA